MWTFRQAEGWIGKDDQLAFPAYSGKGVGKNNPSAQNIVDVGPIPQGSYIIGAPTDTVTQGPYVLPLTPDPTNEMFGRSDFLIHGDSLVDPGNASEGCIVTARSVRERIWASNDHLLKVIA
jgi:hypothetical protein